MSAATDHFVRGLDWVVEGLERRFTAKSALIAVFLLNTQAALLVTYVLVGTSTVYDWWPILVPFVWINVGIAAVAWTEVGPATPQQRALALGIGVGYFLLLGYFGGLYGPGTDSLPTYWELSVARHPPGWDPMIVANTPEIRLAVVFYKLVGYLALAYLVYATVIEAAGSAVGGVVGLLSCVSCTWPALGTVLAGVFGGGSVVAAAAYDWTYVVSTVVFVLTVALLYWRPGFDRVSRMFST